MLAYSSSEVGKKKERKKKEKKIRFWVSVTQKLDIGCEKGR